MLRRDFFKRLGIGTAVIAGIASVEPPNSPKKPSIDTTLLDKMLGESKRYPDHIFITTPSMLAQLKIPLIATFGYYNILQWREYDATGVNCHTLNIYTSTKLPKGTYVHVPREEAEKLLYRKDTNSA